MNSRKMPGLTALAVLGAIGATTGTVSAQQVSENIVSEQQDWAVYEDADPKECWAVAAPKETVNTKDGRVVIYMGDDERFQFIGFLRKK